MRKQTHDGQVTCYVSGMVLPTPLDDYEFDLCGFLVIPSALSGRELGALNQAYDGFPTLGHSDWVGNAQRRACTADTGFELHNLLDCGDPAFDVLIDHPSWIGRACTAAARESRSGSDPNRDSVRPAR